MRSRDDRAESPSARRLLSLVRPHASPLVFASLILLGESAVGLATPRVAGYVVDTAILEHNLARLDWVAMLLLALFAVRGLLAFGHSYLLRAVGARFLRSLRDRVYGHLVGLSPAFFVEQRIGELISRIGSDLARVQSTLTTRIPEGLRAAVTFVGTIIILLLMSVQLTLLALVIAPPIVILSVWFGRRLERLGRWVQDALADTTATAEEALVGIRTVQAYEREEHERTRYRSGLDRLLSIQLHTARVTGVFLGSLQFVGFSAFALVLWYGGRLIVRGDLTPGELTAFLLYAFAIAGSISSLGSLYAGLRELRGASARVFELLDTPSSIPDRGDVELEDAAGAIELDDIYFRYPSAAPDQWALAGASLRIEAGSSLALVGPSGAGKSTIFALLHRFYDVDRGSIRLDGHDLRDLTLSSLRHALAVVPQEIFLFEGTIADNIRYGRLDADLDAIRRVAAAAGADGFIDALPDGYDQRIGERGVKLSAGQRQRLAIARALLRDPRVLLLDEATSALDAETESVVQESLDGRLRGHTVLIIAHRLATARRADRIAVLEAGRIVATGRHDELVRDCPLYRRLWSLQSEDR